LITHIGGRSGINFSNLPRHFNTLIVNELITTIEKFGYHYMYKTTEKGFQYMQAFDELREFVSNKPINTYNIISTDKKDDYYR